MPADDIESAKAIFGSQTDLFIRADLTDYNIYTEYKRGFPRFRFRPGRGSCIVLFTDKYHHLDPLSEHIVSREEHQNAGEYSREILDSVSADQIAALPLPQFTPFFKGLCRKYIETQEATAAIAAELLVDGMDLSKEWCQLYFYASESDEFAFALRLIIGKSSRIDDFSSNQVTCFIAEQGEAQRIQKTPGFCVAATKQEAN